MMLAIDQQLNVEYVVKRERHCCFEHVHCFSKNSI